MKLGKISEAMDLLTQASINNYSKAQYTLAKLYHGDGNIEEAEKWYKLAFKNEVEEAAYDLGNIYYKLNAYEYAIYW
ncbi:MAG: hypothetical protein E7J25_10780, partial [Paeniclostridium sordellii]|nr:hypothetical protein [Paeniclostridium sordellii]